MFQITLQCDFRDDQAARDPKARCWSLDNRSIEVEASNLDDGASKIRAAASVSGWIRKHTNRARTRLGFACPNCAKRLA